MPDVWIAVEWMADKLTFNEIQHALAPSPGKQTGMNLLDFLILPVRVIGCSLACNAPGWVTEFQHPGGYVPICRSEARRNAGICLRVWILWIFDFFVKWSEIVWPLVCEVFHPSWESLVACRLGGSVLLKIICIFLLSTMYHSCMEIYENCESLKM